MELNSGTTPRRRESSHVSYDSFVFVQMFGFLLYVSEYGVADDGGILSIPKVKLSAD